MKTLLDYAYRGMKVELSGYVDVFGQTVHASPTTVFLEQLAMSWAGVSGLEVINAVELYDGNTLLGSQSISPSDWSSYDSGSQYGYRCVKLVAINNAGTVNTVKLKTQNRTYFVASVTSRAVNAGDVVKITITLLASQQTLSCTGLGQGNSCSGGASSHFSRACIGKVVGLFAVTKRLDVLTIYFYPTGTQDASVSATYDGAMVEYTSTATFASAKNVNALTWKVSTDPLVSVDVYFNPESFDADVTHTFKLRITFSG